MVIKEKLSNLHLWDKNPRTIKDKRFETLCKSMTDDPAFLELRPVLATKEGRIYAGNMRYRAAKHLGWTEIPAIITDIDEKLANERAIKDNNEYGDWNNDELATLLDEMEKQGTDISTLGLDEQINKIIEQLNEKEIVEDEVPAVKKDPQTGLGDLWILGSHRLLCGDATKIDDVEKLMNGEKADMVFTDPPYGMDLDTDYTKMGGKWNKKHSEVIGDDTQFNYQDFAWIDCAEQIWFGANYYAKTIDEGGSWYVWDKRVDENYDKMFGSSFELAWSKSKHKQEIVRVNATLFGKDRQDVRGVHPTQKPLQVCSWFLTRLSKDNDVILDLFGGSGSTLIACEQLNRKCYMMELDPQYVRVIIDRWEKLTGLKAVLQ